ncbi:MAG: hypothetical protein KF862_20310 [Chitinophagaceae bacterium]|nr:hypothetical protein [Chitinophagaceae bacterium]
MKQKTSLLSILACSAIIAFTSCKKEKDETGNTGIELVAHTDDQALFSSELNTVNSDADIVLEAFTSIVSARNQESPEYICDAAVAFDFESNPQTMTITYNNKNCRGNRSRSGVVVVAVAKGTQWGQAGASASISFRDLKVTRAGDNKSIIINGTQTYTNVSGGLLKDLSSLESITHAITSDHLSVTFDNSTTRTWQVARQHVFTYSNGIVITASGTHTEGDQANVAEWGTNRFGLTFATSTIEPVMVRQDCDFRVTGGVIKHIVAGFTATATFGLDAQGNPVSCPDGNYYFKVLYTGPGGRSIAFVYPY